MNRQLVIFITTIFVSGAILVAQLPKRRQIQMEMPPINYTNGVIHDPVAELNRRIETGTVRLRFDDAFGYLPALLEALGIARESQLLVFSKTSL